MDGELISRVFLNQKVDARDIWGPKGG